MQINDLPTMSAPQPLFNFPSNHISHQRFLPIHIRTGSQGGARRMTRKSPARYVQANSLSPKSNESFKKEASAHDFLKNFALVNNKQRPKRIQVVSNAQQKATSPLLQPTSPTFMYGDIGGADLLSPDYRTGEATPLANCMDP